MTENSINNQTVRTINRMDIQMKAIVTTIIRVISIQGIRI